MLLQALHVEIEMKNLNPQVTCKRVWERRSHLTTPLVADLMLISSHL